MNGLKIDKKIFAWSLYDFADQAFSALFVTFFFPVLVKEYLGGDEFQIGLTMGLSILFASLLVPIIGAFSDRTGKRSLILAVGAVLTAIFVVLTGYLSLIPALIAAFLANIFHLMAKDVYDAKMIGIVPKEKIGSLSGLGLSFGYAGTVLSLVVAYLILLSYGETEVEAIRLIFILSAVWYIIFTLPILLLVPDSFNKKMGFFRAVKDSVNEIKKTVYALSELPRLLRFLSASFVYNNGLSTIGIFLALYGINVIGFSVIGFFPIFAIMAVASGLGAYFTGKYSDKYGPVSLIKYSLVLWIFITLLLITYPGYTSFLIAGILGGTIFGAIWTLNRHMIASMAPKKKIGEFFGYEGLTDKFSGVLGPIIFGYLASNYGYIPALWSVVAFFVIGLFMIRKI